MLRAHGVARHPDHSRTPTVSKVPRSGYPTADPNSLTYVMSPRWPVLFVALLLLLGVAAGFFWLLGGDTPAPRRGTASADRTPLDDKLEALRTLPYLDFAREESEEAETGVVIHRRGRAHPGYNLYCSRTSPEAFLMDMEGRIVHRWELPRTLRTANWDWIQLLPGGDLLVIESFRDLLLLDRDSNLLWSQRLQVHHEIGLDPDGTAWVPTREVKTYRGAKVRFPGIINVDLEGNVLRRWSAFRHLDELRATFDTTWFLDTLLDEGDDPAESLMQGRKVRSYDFDYFHLNTITVLPDTPLGRRDERFAAGHLLICFRNVNQIAVLHRETFEPLWAWGEGILERPHHPTLLEDGRILVYDNGYWRGHSRVLEVDPLTTEILWEYQAEDRKRFFSPTKGSSYRLPNGNTLITESARGRAFEITRDGEIVWQWLNPRSKDGRREQVYRMERLPLEAVRSWLPAPAADPETQ